MTIAKPSSAAVQRAEAPVSTERVTVIVLNWNGEDDTAACLDSFLAQEDVARDILLVDNASADGSGERLHRRYPAVAYLQAGENLGYSGGNNLGIEWALRRGADWVLVANNDTVSDPDCLSLLLAATRGEPRLAAVAPLIVRYDEPDRVWFAGGHLDRVRAVGVHLRENAPVEVALRELPRGCDVPWLPCTFLTGCCLLLRAAALREVGLFRVEFFAYEEDLELSYRLTHAGWQLGWVPAARIRHRVPPRGTEPTPRQIFLRDRNRQRTVRLHYSLGWRLVFALWFWPTRLIHLARYAALGDTARARAIIAGLRAN